VKKCPVCGNKTNIPVSCLIISSTKPTRCKKCNSLIGINKKVYSYMTALSVVLVILIFLSNIPIDDNFAKVMLHLFTLFVLFALFQISVVPLESREK